VGVRRVTACLFVGALGVLAGACSASSSSVSTGAAAADTGAAAPTPSMSATKTGCPTAGSCFVSANVATIGGIVPGLFKGALVGTDAYLAYQNSLGGLDGRKFKLLSGDDQFSCNLNQALTKQYVPKVIAFTGSYSLQDNCGGQVLGANPSVPNVADVLSPSVAQLPNTFSPSPTTDSWGLGALAYFKAKYPGAVLHVGRLVAGVASSETNADHETAAMNHLGYQIVYNRDYGPLETDFTADVIKMRQAGVQAVDLTFIDGAHAARFMQEASTQGFHPPLVFSAGPIYTAQFVKQAGGAAVVDGTYLTQTQVLYLGEDADSVPAVSQLLRWVHGLYPTFSPDIFTIDGWTSAALYVDALKNAGPSPTRQTLLAALGQIHSFDADGLLVSSDPAGKQGGSCYLLAKIVQGSFVRTDMPDTGFRCDASSYPPPSSTP
jgi:ABC-type branched-subunit amino acid transport system substrate-binding protein